MLASIIVGFAMGTLGVALLLLGEVPFVAGRRIPARRSRLIGVVLVGFLPLAFGTHHLLVLLFDREAVSGPVVTWSLHGFCWLVVFVILFRVMVAKREPRKAARVSPTSAKNPFGAESAEKHEACEVIVEEVEPVKTPAAKKEKEPAPAKKAAKKSSSKKTPKTPADDANPFDFS